MIEFTDSFSQACVAEACAAFPDLRKRLMVELVLPMFTRPLNEVGRVIGKPIIKPNSTLHKTLLFVSPNDMEEHLPKEIGFCRFTCTCNVHGQPTDKWKCSINGIYLNHGSNTAPKWSVHT